MHVSGAFAAAILTIVADETTISFQLLTVRGSGFSLDRQAVRATQ
jgi:hypothetical protein